MIFSSDRILFVSPILGYKSLLYWGYILAGLKKKFPEFRVFTCCPPLSSQDGSIVTENRIRALNCGNRRGAPWWGRHLPWVILPGFLREISRMKPSVIILNEFNLVSFYVILFRRISFPDSRLLLLVENAPGQRRGIGEVLRRSYRRWCARHVDLVQTNNSKGGEYLRDILKVSSERIAISPYLTSELPPCSTEGAEAPLPPLPPGAVRLLFVGQLIHRKGVDLLLRAMAQVPEETRKKIFLEIVGAGDLLDEYRDLTERYHLLEHVHFHGAVAYERLRAYFENSDCFILPTRHDYRALVGFEALGCGLPIIDSRHDGASPEVLQNRNGFLIDPFDTEAFTRLLTHVGEHPEELKEMGERSQVLAAKYSFSAIVENFSNVIGSLCSKGGKGECR